MTTLLPNGGLTAAPLLDSEPPLDLGIPASFANPLMEELDRPWAEEQAAKMKAMRDRRDAALAKIDESLLDPEGFFKKHPFTPTFADDAEKARKSVLVHRYLRWENGGRPLPMGADGVEMMRRKVAARRFEGRGAESDEEFLAEITKGAQGRRDAMETARSLVAAAADDAALPTGDGKGLPGWLATARAMPGYDPSREADYADSFAEARSKAAADIAPIADVVRDTWRAFRADAASAIPAGRLAELSDDEFSLFLNVMRTRADALPDKEKETFLGGMRKDLVRSVEGFYRNAANATVGGVMATDPRAFSPAGVQLPPAADLGDIEGQRKLAETARKGRNRATEIRRVMSAKYDPIDYVRGLGWLQKIPGVTVTSMTMAVPVAGQAVMTASMAGAAQESLYLRFRDEGLSETDAGQYSAALAPLVTAPQMALEKLSFGIISQKHPWLRGAVERVGNRVANRLARGVLKTGAITIAEGTIEVSQDFTQSLVQEFASEIQPKIPGVDLMEEFQGAWAEFPEIAGSMLVLSLFGAAGGLNREARAAAWAEATPRQMRALGIQSADIAAIEAAKGKGPASLTAAVEEGWQRRQADSDEAKSASAEEAAEMKEQAAAVEQGKASGIFPDIVQTADGYMVLDGETKEEVGTAPDIAGAVRLAEAHSTAFDERNAEKVAYLASALEAGEAALAADPDAKGENRFELGTLMTEALAAAENPEAIDQFHEQAGVRERINGGSGDVTRVALGQHRTEFRGEVRQWTNRFFRGSSVTTVFHELWHGLWRKQQAAGTISRDEALDFVMAVNEQLGGTLKRGRMAGEKLALLPEGIAREDVTDGMIDEALSEIGEMEVLRTRKRGADAKATRVGSGVIARNLLSLSRLAPGATKKFRALIEAARGIFGLSSARALAMKKAIREGKISEAEIEAFMDRMAGRDLQTEHAGNVAAEQASILGDAIPESELPAFLRKKGGSVAAKIVDDNAPFSLGRQADFEAAVDGILDGTYDMTKPVPLGDTPKAFELAGANALPVTMPPSVVKKATSGKHDLPADLVKQVPAALHDPVFVFESETVPDALTAILDLAHYGENVLVAVHLDKRQQQHQVNSIASIYDKSNPRAIEGWMKNGLLRYIHTQKGRAWFRSRGLQLPKEGSLRGNANLHTEADLVKGAEDGPFSLSPAAFVESLSMNVTTRIKDPKVKAAMFTRMLDRLGSLKRDRDELGIAFGKHYKRRAIQDPRTEKSIRREAAVREAIRREELEDEAHAKHGGILQGDDLSKLWNNPTWAAIATPGDPLHGRIMSFSAALSRGENFFDPKKQGDYDGADGVPRVAFGGQNTPDQIAEELYRDGLLKEPTADALWAALKREAAGVGKMKEAMAAARADVRKARQQAKEEATAWMNDRLNEEAANYSPRQRLLRALATLDAILSVMPPEVRGKVGGYTQLAKLNSDEARLKFLNERIAKADAALEKWLAREYGKMFHALLEREKVKKNAAGKKPKGKAGADVHALFKVVRAFMEKSGDEAEAHAAGLMALVAKGEMTPEQEAHATLEAGLVTLVSDWKNADSARRAAALDVATRTFENGYYAFQAAKIAEREKRKARREALVTDTGKAGTAAERDKKFLDDHGLRGGMKDFALSLGSFEQLMTYVFGENSAEMRRMVDWERKASDRREDGTRARFDALTMMLEDMAGGGLAGEQLRWKLGEKKHKIDGRTLSELEMITATLMWRQADGRRHMEGHKDDTGNFTGPWHYGQEFVDSCEAALSDEARTLRDFLSADYGREWDTLNPIFRKLNGIDLPKHTDYSPITVAPLQEQGGQVGSPDETGAILNGTGMTPGSLRTRGTSIAEPVFADALKVWTSHVMQMEHWKAYAEFAGEAGAMLGNRELRNAVEAKGGEEARKILRGWVDYFAQGGIRDASAHLAINQNMNRWMNNAAATALVGRMSVLVIQSTQLGAALAEMPTASYLLRFGKLMTGQLGWGKALSSDLIQRRLSQMPPVVRQAMEGLRARKPNALKHQVAKIGRLISGADALFTAGTYAICYDYQLGEARRQGLTGADAENYASEAAERSVDRVAQPTRAGARSFYEVTATNPMFRLSWAFASEARQKLAISGFTLANPDADIGRKARALAVTWIVGGMFAELVRAVMRDMRDDDDEEFFDEKNWGPKRLALSALVGPLNAVPVVGDLAESALFAVAGEYLPEGNMLSNLPRGAQRVTKIPDWFTGDRDAVDIARDVETILSGMGALSRNASAAASVSHFVTDLFRMADNALSDD